MRKTLNPKKYSLLKWEVGSRKGKSDPIRKKANTGHIFLPFLAAKYDLD